MKLSFKNKIGKKIKILKSMCQQCEKKGDGVNKRLFFLYLESKRILCTRKPFFTFLSLETLGINGEVMKETLNRLCFPPSPGSLSQILSALVSHSNLILDIFFLFFSPPPSFSIFLHNTE